MTVRFSYDRYYGYRCSESGDQSGEYVPAAELARVTAQRDSLRVLVERYWEWQATCQELLPDDMADATLALLSDAPPLADILAQRDALLAALKGLLSDPNGVLEVCAARAAIAQARGAP